MEDVNTGDSSASTEVESATGVLDQGGLAAMLRQSRVPVSQEVESEAETVESEVTPEVEQPEADISETPIDTETQSQEGVEEEEAEEQAEETEENVLSQFEKTKKKMRKSIDKNFKLRKEAEEREEVHLDKINELEAKVKQLMSGETPVQPSQPKGLASKVESAESIDDLVEIQSTAKSVVENADDALFELSQSGEGEIEIGGQSFTAQELRDTKKEAQAVLDTHIGNKAQLFEQRAQYDNAAIQTFDFLRNPEDQYYKFAEEVMQSDTQINEFLNGRPDQFYILGLMAEGKRALDAREAQANGEKGKTEEKATPKPNSTPKIAPQIPGVKASVAPARATGEQKAQQQRKEILSRNNLNTRDLAQLIAASKNQ